MSEIRYDRLHDMHVIIAPERLHRPDCTFKTPASHRHSKACPFCEGNETMTPPEIYAIRKEGSFANESGWLTRVVPNLYKAVQIETPYRHHFGAFEYDEGFGAHEVIVDIPLHRTSMTQFEHDEIVNWLTTLGVRVGDLRKDGRIAYLSIFKNEGTDAGATQPHAHTQLIGLPVVPLPQQRYFERAAHFYKEEGRSLLQSVVDQERQAEDRVIAEQDGWVAYCPFASAFPFEVIIADTEARGQIDTLDGAAKASAASMLQNILDKLKQQLGWVAFNLEVATPPLKDELQLGLLEHTDAMFGLTFRIMPRIYRLGGFELSTQTIINPVTPEEAAGLLKAKKGA